MNVVQESARACCLDDVSWWDMGLRKGKRVSEGGKWWVGAEGGQGGR